MTWGEEGQERGTALPLSREDATVARLRVASSGKRRTGRASLAGGIHSTRTAATWGERVSGQEGERHRGTRILMNETL